MNEVLQNIPTWLKIAISLLFGTGGGGYGVHQWYKTKLQSDRLDFEKGTSRRDELRGDLDKLRERQQEYEIELTESRNKYFELQEKYHQLKLNHDEVLRENKRMRAEIQQLRDEIQQLRETLG